MKDSVDTTTNDTATSAATAICPVCGAEFPAAGTRVYCSAKCRDHELHRRFRERRRALRMAEARAELDCPVCGRRFTPANVRQKVCSHRCRSIMHHRLRSGLPVSLAVMPLVTAESRRAKAVARDTGGLTAEDVRRVRDLAYAMDRGSDAARREMSELTGAFSAHKTPRQRLFDKLARKLHDEAHGVHGLWFG